MNYKEELENILKKHELELREFNYNYAKDNCPYNIGDIVEDHYQRVRITNIIGFNTLNGEPTLIFEGHNLTKKNEVKKREPITRIYESNIKIKI